MSSFTKLITLLVITITLVACGDERDIDTVDDEYERYDKEVVVQSLTDGEINAICETRVLPQYIFSMRSNCYAAADSAPVMDDCLASVEECLDKADLVVDSTNMDTGEACDLDHHDASPACQFAGCIHNFKILRDRGCTATTAEIIRCQDDLFKLVITADAQAICTSEDRVEFESCKAISPTCYASQ
ncbi:MAG: hypothetical protein VYA30_02545 [Myxococcota bacterium]|nr:hypothetical protein [Myxococcota bacterium]